MQGFILIAFLFIQICSLGQTLNPYFIHYGLEDGLPSSQVYDITSDDQGFIWFATDRGVCQFDGQEFQTFSTQEGLSSSSVFKFFKDKQGRIWCLSWVNRLCYIENNQIKPYQYNKLLEDSLPRPYQDVKMHLDEDETVHFISMSSYCTIDKNGHFEWIHKRNENRENIQIQTHLIEDRLLPIITTGWEQDLSNTIALYSEGSFQYQFQFATEDVKVQSAFKADQNYLLIDNSIIGFTANFQKTQPFKYKPIDLDTIQQQLVVGFYKGGVAFLNEDLSIQKQLLNPYSVTSVFKDSQGGTWFSTLENGVFYLPENSSNTFDYTSEAIAFCQKDDAIFVGFTDGKVFKIVQEEIELYTNLRKNNTLSALHEIRVDPTSNNLQYCLSSTEENVSTDILSIDSLVWGHDISFSSSTYSYVNVPFGVHKYVNGELDTTIHTDANVRCQTYFNEQLLLGTVNGLFLLEDDELRPIQQHPLLKERIHTMIPFEKKLLIGTLGAGLLIAEEDRLRQLSVLDGLSGNDITAIHLKGDSIFMATGQGIDLVRITDDSISIIRTFSNYKKSRINNLTVKGNKIWIASSAGLQLIEMSPSTSKKEVPIYITKVSVNGQSMPNLKNGLTLDYTQNKIHFNFKALILEPQKNVNYQYRLIGDETEWNQTTEDEINFVSLKPGNYIFEVSLSGTALNYSSKIASFEFSITPPFWRTTSFFIILVFAFIITLLLIARYFKKRYELRSKIVELQSQAVMLQISPHFIFNALNSIRNYVYQNVDLADHYITQFSLLMRNILSSSSDKHTTITKEVELLKSYVELEQMRANQPFTYEIKVDEDIEPDLDTIPNLIIQPYVENAIVHGLVKQGGHLELNFMRTNSSIITCTITDNCGGFEADVENEKRGTGITAQRLNIISPRSSVHINSQFVHPSGDKGTQITIKFIVP